MACGLLSFHSIYEIRSLALNECRVPIYKHVQCSSAMCMVCISGEYTNTATLYTVHVCHGQRGPALSSNII